MRPLQQLKLQESAQFSDGVPMLVCRSRTGFKCLSGIFQTHRVQREEQRRTLLAESPNGGRIGDPAQSSFTRPPT